MTTTLAADDRVRISVSYEIGETSFQGMLIDGNVHSFTDPTANSDGARYNERSAERAFEMMDDFAEEV